MPNTSGTAVIVVTVMDSGGTQNGGINTVAQSFTVTVSPVNQAPTLAAISNVTIPENTTTPVVINLSNITPGPGDTTQLVTVTASSQNAGLIANPSVSYSNFNSQGMPNTTGTLSFIPVANASGTATINVTVTDNGPTGGANVNSFSQSFLVTVTPVNQPPTLNQIGSPITLLENAGQAKAGVVTINSSGSITIPVANGGSGYTSAPTVTLTGGTFTTAATATAQLGSGTTAGMVVAIVVNGGTGYTAVPAVTIAPPPQTINLSNITAGPGDAGQGITSIVATSSNPTLIPNPTIAYTSPSATGTLSFTPTANMSGTANITVTVTDNGSPAASFSRSFTVIITPVNQPPTLDPISNVTVPQNTSSVNAVEPPITLTGIGTGTGDVGQAIVNVFATSSNPALVTNPAITYANPSATGTLTYSVLPNVSGTATITVTVMDNGGVANGGVNTFSQTFTVTVSPVNQPPTLNPITPNPLVLPVSPGMQTVNLTGLGDGNGGTETIVVTASSSNPALIPNTGPGAIAVTYTSPNPAGTLSTGTVTFTPVAGQTGTAVITVTVTNSDPTGTGSNTFSQMFTVAVAPTHSAPVVTTSAGPTSFIQGSGPIPVDSGVLIAPNSSTGSPTLRSATVAITGNFAGAQDVLGLNAAGLALLTAPPTATAGPVTLNGSGSITIPVAYAGAEYVTPPVVTLTSAGGTFTTAATATANLGSGSDRRHGRVDHRQRRDGLHRGPDRHDRPADRAGDDRHGDAQWQRQHHDPGRQRRRRLHNPPGGQAGQWHRHLQPPRDGHGGARHRRHRRHGRLDHCQRRDGLHRGPDRHDRPAGGTGDDRHGDAQWQRQHHDPGCQRRQRLHNRSDGHADRRHIHHRRDRHGQPRHRP